MTWEHIRTTTSVGRIEEEREAMATEYRGGGQGGIIYTRNLYGSAVVY